MPHYPSNLLPSHYPLLLQDLHWLPVKQMIHFKHLLDTFKAIHKSQYCISIHDSLTNSDKNVLGSLALAINRPFFFRVLFFLPFSQSVSCVWRMFGHFIVEQFICATEDLDSFPLLLFNAGENDLLEGTIGEKSVINYKYVSLHFFPLLFLWLQNSAFAHLWFLPMFIKYLEIIQVSHKWLAVTVWTANGCQLCGSLYNSACRLLLCI